MTYAHPQCYAASLNGCSREISREHYISHAVLKRLGPSVEIGGVPWLPQGKTRCIPIARVVSKVLCTRHNSALSGLDAVAGELFEAFETFNRELSPPLHHALHRAVAFEGPAFERWLIKVYCGLHVGGHLGADGVALPPPQIPAYLIDALFEAKPLPLELGLYFGGPIGKVMFARKAVGFTVAARPDTSEVCSIRAELFGFEFWCTLRPASATGTGKMDGMQRHPVGVQFVVGDRIRDLDFRWPA